MARITKIFISGKIENLISYERDGKPYLRAIPDEVRQTKATKRSAKNFGKAARIAKFLRWNMKAVIPPKQGRYAEYRLNHAVAKWLLTIAPRAKNTDAQSSDLFSLGLSKKTVFGYRITIPLETDWTKKSMVGLSIPDITPSRAIVAPAHTRRLHWTITVTGSSIKEPGSTDVYTAAFEMDYNDVPLPARQIELPFRLKPGSINIIAVSVQYLVMKKGRLTQVTKEGWTPAAIVDGFYQP